MSESYRNAYIYVRNVFAGVLSETDYGYSFQYDEEYLQNKNAAADCRGSGSAGIACKNTDRRFIGIEADDYYFQTAKERIEKGYGV